MHLVLVAKLVPAEIQGLEVLVLHKVASQVSQNFRIAPKVCVNEAQGLDSRDRVAALAHCVQASDQVEDGILRDLAVLDFEHLEIQRNRFLQDLSDAFVREGYGLVPDDQLLEHLDLSNLVEQVLEKTRIVDTALLDLDHPQIGDSDSLDDRALV